MREVDLIIYSDTLVTCAGDGKPKTGKAMEDVGVIQDAGVAVHEGTIIKIGSREDIRRNFRAHSGGEEIETLENPVLPGLIDSHTHPVFAGNRVKEFIMRTRGATYQEIHEAGGGIQFTVDETRKASFDDLYRKGREVLLRMLGHGTTTVEAKSGYGLETREELRELKVLKQLDEDLPVDVVSTFLGAHSLPREYKDNSQEFIRLVIEEMLPLVKEEKLADFVDVFCEKGAFSLDETRRILKAAGELGFSLKLHAEEFSNLGGAVMAGKMGAVSVDHLLHISDEDIKALAATETILTLMPGTLFFLDMREYAPARKIIEGGAGIALATDFNAGSCMSESMLMAMSLGCIAMKMSPEEVINASTYNASFAVGRNSSIGSIEEGKKADMVIFDIDNYREIPYHFGVNLVRMVIKNGKISVQGDLKFPGRIDVGSYFEDLDTRNN